MISLQVYARAHSLLPRSCVTRVRERCSRAHKQTPHQVCTELYGDIVAIAEQTQRAAISGVSAGRRIVYLDDVYFARARLSRSRMESSVWCSRVLLFTPHTLIWIPLSCPINQRELCKRKAQFIIIIRIYQVLYFYSLVNITSRLWINITRSLNERESAA